MNANTLVSERTLWDELGNRCKIELHHIGVGVFELYIHDFNDSVPRRHVGRLGECINKGETFLARKKSEGFLEQLPSYNPQGTRES